MVLFGEQTAAVAADNTELEAVFAPSEVSVRGGQADGLALWVDFHFGGSAGTLLGGMRTSNCTNEWAAQKTSAIPSYHWQDLLPISAVMAGNAAEVANGEKSSLDLTNSASIRIALNVQQSTGAVSVIDVRRE